MKGLFKSKPKTPAELVRQMRDLLILFDAIGIGANGSSSSSSSTPSPSPSPSFIMKESKREEKGQCQSLIKYNKKKKEENMKTHFLVLVSIVHLAIVPFTTFVNAYSKEEAPAAQQYSPMPLLSPPPPPGYGEWMPIERPNRGRPVKIAEFAVDEYNRRNGYDMIFSKVLRGDSRNIVRSGANRVEFRLTIRVRVGHGGSDPTYVAQVMWHPSTNAKKLKSFRPGL